MSREIANEITDYFRAGAALSEYPDAPCPHYATSDAAAGWHAGHQYAGPLNAGEILLATKGRGDRVNLFGGPSLKFAHIVAVVSWNDDDEHRAGVRFEAATGANSSSAYRAEIQRRLRESGDVAMTERDRELIQLRAKAPIAARGRAVADAGHLPLFIAANEPTLF